MYDFSKKLVSNQVEVHLNVFGSLIEYRISFNVNGTSVIIVDGDRLWVWYAEIL